VQPAFVVVLDAAHGGADAGARLGDSLLEKTVTLDFSSRLRSVLAARGIYVVSTRTSDTDMPAKDRAGLANHSLAAACLIVHATATGSGVHLFTSSLPPASASGYSNSPGFLPWQTAQAGWATRSLRLSSEINSALGQAGIPVTLGGAAIEPLDSLTCPAVAIEIAPLAASPAGKAQAITDPAYQQRILDAVAASILEWNTDWKQQP
jgi:N-acetylmuramoyl-L-alanine amidase